MGVRKFFSDIWTGLMDDSRDNVRHIDRGEPSASYGGSYYNGDSHYFGSRSGGAKWPYGLSASGDTYSLDHYTLRHNARDAYHESMQARAVVDRFADTVADVGLMLDSTPKAAILGITEEEAEIWATNVEERFDLWARSKKSCRSEVMNFYQSHRLYSIFQQRDGDVFPRLYYSADRRLLNPLQFQFVEPDQIRGDAYTNTDGFNEHCPDGIERDAAGREVGYKVWVKKGSDREYEYKEVTVPAKGRRSGRYMMLHGFCPEYAGQRRGYSRLAHAIQEFENITDFSAATIKKAINQSNIVAWVKPSQDNPASNPFEGILTDFGAGPAAEQFGSQPCPSSEATGVTDESRCPVTCYEVPEATSNVPGSMWVNNLEEGEDIRFANNTAPGDSFDKFVDAFTSYLCASMSIPIEVLLMRFNQNYSASRGSLILFWRVAQLWRNEMCIDYCDPVYEMWLDGEIGAGRISAPGWSDPVLRAAWLSCRWTGAPMPNIDPLKTANADMTYVEMGAQTLDDVARNLNGSTGKSNRAKLARQYEELPNAPWNNNTAAPAPGDGGDDDA